jgi:hypothetical protein
VQPTGVSDVDPVADLDCLLVPGVWVLAQDGRDLAEDLTLPGGRQRRDMADAPDPVDDLLMRDMLDVVEG